MEKREPSYTVGGNANSHYGEQCGDSILFLLPIQLLKFFIVLCLLILIVIHLFLWFIVFYYELISSKTWFLENAYLPLTMEEESCHVKILPLLEFYGFYHLWTSLLFS